ncbi:hypothetical protein, conserved [Plasmodium gonderi]|uniref:DnaJ protein n=1 Tax=Plasmodium gonderi TaxID=77519 RepID=A0A1Y1JK08_PLAGO|nr:hypothetical protein, conserved [Plasmodium gonderi]GAW81537.1 hypothetical protein, conserved [Plasmodium gonderi]
MLNNQTRNPYSILNVGTDCDIETAKKQFKKLALIYHPDKLKHHLNRERKCMEKYTDNRDNTKNCTSGSVPINEQNKQEKENVIDFVTLVWAYEQILKDIEHSNKSEKYENALNIKKVDLQYINEENSYIYFCRCGDFFLFSENLYCEYYIIYECQSCSCSVYVIP